MNIIYQKKLERTPTIDGRPFIGVSEAEIAASEVKLGVRFPQSYREYLYLAGKFPGGLSSQFMPDRGPLNQLTEDYHYLQEHLSKINIKIERPIWAFSEMEGYAQCWFFYLDEGDDPPVWGLIYTDDPYETSYIYPINDTFSNFIDKMIDSAIRFAKQGY